MVEILLAIGVYNIYLFLFQYGIDLHSLKNK